MKSHRFGIQFGRDPSVGDRELEVYEYHFVGALTEFPFEAYAAYEGLEVFPIL